MGDGGRQFRMIVCSVLGRAYTIEGHLKFAEAMHDVPTVRSLSQDELDGMIRPCQCTRNRDSAMATPAEKCDLMFVPGLGPHSRPGFSVINSEYIAYHPHQCLPKYEIVYEME